MINYINVWGFFMKRKIITIILAVMCVFTLASCKGNVDKYDDNISELRTNIYRAESETMSVKAITGRRENPYVLNGISDAKKEFTVVTIVPAPFVAGKKYSYSIKIDGTEHKGEFLPHPFEESLSAEINVKTQATNLELVVVSGEITENFTLASVISADSISAEKALTIALGKLKPQLKEFQTGSRLNAEIYLSLTENPIDNTGGFFWYVAFVNEQQTTLAVLLRCDTGEVSAIKDKI